MVEGSAADTTNVTFAGTVTDATHYIEVKTDAAATYGRHQGVWSTSKYRLTSTAGGQNLINIQDDYFRVTGLQMSCAGSCINILVNTPNGHTSDIRISNNILVNDATAAAGVGFSDPNWGTNNTLWNNIIYATGGTGNIGVRFLNTGTSQNKAYNNTIVGFSEGIHKYGITTLKNNLFSANTTDVGNGPATDTYNATNNDNTKGLSAGGTGNRFSQTFTFAGAGNYHLASTDAGAKGYGVSDPGAGLFSDDIDGQTRSSSWDIGADQYVTYTIGGTISGLTGTVVLQNNGGDNLTLSSNGLFTFATALAMGSSYSVTVSSQPVGQSCTVGSGSGIVASSNVTSVSVTCTTLDASGPTPGNSGTITTASITDQGLILNWTKSTDNVSAQANLQYRVFKSTSNNIDTVANVFANGTALNATTSDIATLNVSSLNPSSTYYFNVLVVDEAGNTTAYTMKSQATLADSIQPVVDEFTIPSTASSLTVNINSFTAHDDIAVTGYMATTSSSAPASGDSTWLGSAPTTYTFATSGALTLYGWVKDAAGNVSLSASASITITLPTGNVYWVSPTGAATWVNCHSDTALSGASACSRTTALTNAVAGDTVYFRNGTYSVTGSGLDYEGLKSSNSGTSQSNRITFARYSNEVPIITSSAPVAYGIYLSGNSYIKIDGFTFQDIATWVYIIKSSSYNEITNSTFTSTTGHEAGGGITISGTLSCAGLNCWNTHNWIHGNTFSKRLTTPCGEGANLLTIGQAYGAGNTVNNDNYNTIENNTFAYSAHGGIENNSMYTVIRNNFLHNEPWISGCTNYQQATSNTSLTINTSNQTLTTQTGLSYGVNDPIGIIYASDYSKAMSGIVQSYNSGTGQLVVRNIKTSGSGTYSNWILSQKNVPYYDNANYNGLFGHRNIQIGDDYARDATHVLLEGNRLGNAGNNPGNGGPSNLDLASPKNIVRYNDIFNGMASGIYFKYSNSTWWSGETCTTSRVGNNGACGGMFNRVYNNTIYHNGYGDNWRIYGNMNNAYNGEGIAQWDLNGTGPTGNVIKNNIVYDNKEGDICQLGLYDTACTPESWDTLISNWITTNGDPKFVSADVSDATSETLPNFSLQSSSSLINGGTYLTQASGSGSNSTTLVVGDALYFQDGTWGSDLARGVNFYPDWIAIGNINNIVQISSINYSTNTITLASPMTWSNGANIWLYKKSDGVRVLYGLSSDYGAHEYASAEVSSTKAITSFDFNSLSPTVTGSVSEGGHTVSLTVPYGTSVTALVPTISITGSSVSPASNVAQNFTSPVSYTVTAADSSTQAYTVTVTIAPIGTHTITASAGGNGSISPSGSVSVNDGSDQAFTITPNSGYHIDTVTADSVAVSATSPYTFTNVTANHTISATFVADAVVVVSGGGGGGSSSGGSGYAYNYNQILNNAINNKTIQPVVNQSTSYIFTKNMTVNTRSTDIMTLQQFLNRNGYPVATSGPGSLGNETNYFGTLTFKALIRFQRSVGLPATGYFGPMTRELIKKSKVFK